MENWRDAAYERAQKQVKSGLVPSFPTLLKSSREMMVRRARIIARFFTANWYEAAILTIIDYYHDRF